MTMKLVSIRNSIILLGFTALMFSAVGPAGAEYNIQCPAGATPLENGKTPKPGGLFLPDDSDVCMHVTGSDGFNTEADGKRLYSFGFKDATQLGFDAAGLTQAVANGIMGQNQSSAQIELNEGDNFYLTLSNPGMVLRPDLFDPHTVHYHGFPEASAIFDGVPEQTVSINQEASITYFYNNYEPGTFAWHCHVEATEHMQMGMLGALFVKPMQNKTAAGTNLNGQHTHVAGDEYVFNDGDGETHYDVEKMLLFGALDGDFHDASEGVQPLPFAEMRNNYPTINGRGYPDTMRPISDPVLTDFSDWTSFGERGAGPGGSFDPNCGDTVTENCDFRNTQPIDSIVPPVTVGQKLLLRLVNLDVTRAYSVQLSGGLKFEIVGRDGRINRGHGSSDVSANRLAYKTSTIDVDGGTTHDVIIDTTGVPEGKYVLYTTNMNYLSNDQEDFGGIMTEINITAP